MLLLLFLEIDSRVPEGGGGAFAATGATVDGIKVPNKKRKEYAQNLVVVGVQGIFF